MEQQGNFLLMDKSEFRAWLAAQKITRTITKLQVHHTAAPNYSTRKMVNGVAQQDHFAALEGMRTYHLSQGWTATGQNITTFEDGKIAISLDRDLNETPAGIKGANTGALCVENIGNFDEGGDTMTDAQRETIVYLYACLCEKLSLTPGYGTLVYHAWYTADGTWLGDYTAGKSSKTCPGTAFWGDGNSKAAAMKGFIPAVVAEYNTLISGEDDEEMTTEEKAAFKALQDKVTVLENRLNINGDQTYASNYAEAVSAAKTAGMISTSADKSKLELNVIQMLHNIGLTKTAVVNFLKSYKG